MLQSLFERKNDRRKGGNAVFIRRFAVCFLAFILAAGNSLPVYADEGAVFGFSSGAGGEKEQKERMEQVSESFRSRFGLLPFDREEEAALVSSSAKADEATVTVTGELPQDFSVSVETVASENEDQILSRLASEGEEAGILKAYDISLLKSDGNEFQPEKEVTVEIADPAIASAVGDIHVFHEGVEITEGVELTEQGVRFPAPGFSEYAVAYTVDFAYDGYSWSMDGGESVLVSGLLESLGISLPLEQIAEVHFSDESLVRVDREGEDWRLVSLQAFSTTEKLEIELADGNVIEVEVTDAMTYQDADAVDAMFGNPNISIELKTAPDDNDMSAVPNNAVGGTLNADGDGSNPYMVWKSSVYNESDNSVDITLNFFQKQIGMKLDFIFVIDETTTMDHNAKANEVNQSKALWARYAACRAAKTALDLNTEYDEYGVYNRAYLISWGGSKRVDSGFLDNYSDVLSHAAGYDVIRGATNHTLPLGYALEVAQVSKAAGRTPVVIYLSDYKAHFDRDVVSNSAAQLKTVVDYIYAMAVFIDYDNDRIKHMNRLVNETYHYWMDDKDDPSTLITPMAEIVKDTIERCRADLAISDVLSEGAAAGADANGITSSGDGTNAPAYDASTDSVEWELINNGERLYTGKMYTKVVNIALTDDAYGGFLKTNKDLSLKVGDDEVNSIPESSAPSVEKDLIICLKEKESSGAPIAGANFTLIRGETSWTLSTDENGKIRIPWSTADSDDYAAFVAGNTYILRQDSTKDGCALPLGTWTLTADEDYKIETEANSVDTGARNVPAGASEGVLEFYNDPLAEIAFTKKGRLSTEEDSAAKALSGVTFDVYESNVFTDENKIRTSVVSDSNGAVSFSGFNVGTYYLKETAVPEDYDLPSGYWTVPVKNDLTIGTIVKTDPAGDTPEFDGTAIINVKPVNPSADVTLVNETGEGINVLIAAEKETVLISRNGENISGTSYPAGGDGSTVPLAANETIVLRVKEGKESTFTVTYGSDYTVSYAGVETPEITENSGTRSQSFTLPTDSTLTFEREALVAPTSFSSDYAPYLIMAAAAAAAIIWFFRIRRKSWAD
ncbi:MAG: prealbumin-like fold domain-containing protein [Lachnospiraceae bacterium]|nr:prealbumin-like fold domain-containing protein [Lachnospiraceae bacterium]